MTIESIVERLSGVRRSGSGYLARCPAPEHDDADPSLSISPGANGGTVLHCFAGCRTEDVVAALGLSMADLSRDSPACEDRTRATCPRKRYRSLAEAEQASGLRRVVARYPYSDGSKTVVMTVLRGEPKTFRPIEHHEDGTFSAGKPPGATPLYRPRELPETGLVHVAEGEKDADALAALGFNAVASAGGANAAMRTDWSPLARHHVVIWPDNDSAGRAYAETVARRLTDIGASVRIVEWPAGTPEKFDVSDLIEACEDEPSAYEALQPLEDAARLFEGAPQAVDVLPDSPCAWSTLPELYQSDEFRAGAVPITTGFAALDGCFGGFRPGSTYVLAGRTGNGKSTFATNIARKVALLGHSTLLLKLEERKVETLWRLISAAAGVPLDRIIDAKLTTEDRRRIDEAWDVLCDAPLRISDARELTAMEAAIRQHKANGGELVIVDQVNLVTSDGAAAGYECVTRASNRLRILAADLTIPILILCQVNREAARKADPLAITDLRDSGSLENDACAVVLLDRSEDYSQVGGKAGPVRRVTVWVGKNRYGRTTPDDEPLYLDWWPCIQRMEGHQIGATA